MFERTLGHLVIEWKDGSNPMGASEAIETTVVNARQAKADDRDAVIELVTCTVYHFSLPRGSPQTSHEARNVRRLRLGRALTSRTARLSSQLQLSSMGDVANPV